jgi:hypothetical protein
MIAIGWSCTLLKTVSPPMYRRYKPRNLAVVRIAGRDHYLGAYGSPESKEKYARLIKEFCRDSSAASARSISLRPSTSGWSCASGPGSGRSLSAMRDARLIEACLWPVCALFRGLGAWSAHRFSASHCR